MERTSKKKKFRFGLGSAFKRYFSDFGLRQATAITLLVSSIVALVGICIPEEITMLVGLYLYFAGAVMGIVAAVIVLGVVRNRRAPQFKRSLIALILLIIVLALALTGILVTHIHGIFN